MGNISDFLEGRYSEIDDYIKLLEDIDHAIVSGTPKVGETTISTRQQRVLKSSVYIQLYNLVEATVTSCADTVCTSAIVNGNIKPHDLNEKLKQEWVRFTARTHLELNAENRLTKAIEMCNYLTDSLPISEFKLEKGGGGNWDDNSINKLAERIGCDLSFKPETFSQVKRPIRNDKGPLELVVNLRNRLAHGGISFEDCGQNDTAKELRELSEIVISYLRELATAFEKFIEQQLFLKEEARIANN